jgi:hypothetical protein
MPSPAISYESCISNLKVWHISPGRAVPARRMPPSSSYCAPSATPSCRASLSTEACRLAVCAATTER